ncbi:MAG TPA: hypothetical protein VGB37_15420 [Candidatus Lokiarchaeia archaeon]
MIFKIYRRENPFVQVDKDIINDKNLSWKSKGILVYLLSKPDSWKIYEKEISEHSKDGIRATRSGIKELIKFKYIERIQKKDKQNKFAGYEYNVYEVPKDKWVTSVMPFCDNGECVNGKEHTTNIDNTNINITNIDNVNGRNFENQVSTNRFKISLGVKI